MKSIVVLAGMLAVTLSPLSARVVQQGPADVDVRVEKGQLDFLIGKTVVTSYQVKEEFPRPFFWPLLAPDGTPTTRDFPMVKDKAGETKDHPHHRSAWFTYGDVVPEGLKLKSKVRGIEGVDFWTEGKAGGRIVCVKVHEPQKAPGAAWVTTENEWRTVDKEKVMDETRVLRLYALPKAYLIVFDIDLHASVYPITFADTKEGAMAIRIRSDITVDSRNGKIQNADGLVNKAEDEVCWGLKSSWCDYSGKVGDSVIGVALMDDPANPRPAFWHARNYGLMAANAFAGPKSTFPAAKSVESPIHLAMGEHLRLRYGILVHHGDAEAGQVEAAFQQFIRFRAAEKR
jgi:hypothetical protein